MATLKETKRRNDVASDLEGLESQGDSAITQLVAVKANILGLQAGVQAEEQFSDADAAEVQAVIVGLASRIQSEVFGG